MILNIPAVEPAQKHALIFDVFGSLQPGAALVLHNDHDPKPVYFQMKAMHGDGFDWEYLQQGPQWWDIRITKKDSDTQNTSGKTAAQEAGK